MEIIAFSVPFFLGLIVFEVIVARVRHRQLFRLNDSISDLSLGILSQLSGIFTKLIQLGVYIVIADRFAVQHFVPEIGRAHV